MKSKIISFFVILILILNITANLVFATDISNDLEINEELIENQDELNEKNNIPIKQEENKEDKAKEKIENEEKADSVSAKASSFNVAAESISFGYNHTAVTTDRVNVRKAPSTSSTVLITAPLNAEVNILNIEKDNGFYQVEYVTPSKTYYGYMHSDYMKFVPNISVNEGDTYGLIAILTPSNSDEIPVFKSDNSNIAEVSSNGVITGKKAGTVIIKGTIDSGLSDYVVVEVKENKKMPATSISFGYSHTGKTTAKVNMRKKASTKSKKVVKIKKGKTVTITAKNTTNGFYKAKYKSGSKTYSGYIQNKYLKRNSNISIVATHKKKLSPKVLPSNSTDNIKYTSSDATIATVDKDGTVTGKKTGTVLITAKTDSGKSDYATVYIKKYVPISSITLNTRSYVKVGNTATLKRTISPSNTTESVSWKSENTDVATVNNSGVVTGKKAGIVNIVASSPNGLNVKTSLYVAEKDTFSLNQRAAAVAAKYPNVNALNYGTSVLGQTLEAYEIKGNGTNENVIFIEAAVHGYEDEYAKDGKVLVALANGLIDYYARNPDKLKDYTLVVVPCANPDGIIYGNNNQRANGKNPFGRCTYDGVDINRDFRDDLFKAKESRALRDLMLIYASKLRVHLDLHGWENSVIGDRDIVNIVRSSTGIATDKSGRYGEANGYVISYTRFTLGAHAALVEFKNSKSVNESKFESALNKIMNSSIFLPEY